MLHNLCPTFPKTSISLKCIISHQVGPTHGTSPEIKDYTAVELEVIKAWLWSSIKPPKTIEGLSRGLFCDRIRGCLESRDATMASKKGPSAIIKHRQSSTAKDWLGSIRQISNKGVILVVNCPILWAAPIWSSRFWTKKLIEDRVCDNPH